jgi:septal ring factor EnvC (AmiA/AmiB activator)
MTNPSDANRLGVQNIGQLGDEPKTEAEKINEIEEYYERQLETMDDDLKQLRASLREQQLEHQTLVTKEQEERNSLAQAEVHVVEISNECQRLKKQLEKLQIAKRKLMGMWYFSDWLLNLMKS